MSKTLFTKIAEESNLADGQLVRVTKWGRRFW